MGKLVVSEFISLDGVIEEPAWSFEFDRGEEGETFKRDELKAAGALLQGRITYQGMAQAWPTMEGTGWFGERMNSMPKFVVSTTLGDDDAKWTNSTVIRGDVKSGVAQVKEQIAEDILVFGSAHLVQGLARHDLVDEYRLMLYPIVLGGGKRLFAEDMPRTKLRLVDSRPLGKDGILLLTYEPAR
jgi:dihydrofolate reductase